MNRIILHVDMDAFFAAVEQRDHPQYAGLPVIVGADPREGHGRGVVSTCSYEARVYGIHSAMPISQAYKLCPNGIYLPPNGQLYKQVSNEIFTIFQQFTDMVEPLSIDEAFLDVTGSSRILGDGPAIAAAIKKMVRENVRLTCSIGVAPNKYLAKIASDLEKPDGLVVVYPHKINEFLQPLDISRLWGAGKKTQEIFHRLGIQTIGDLARLKESFLREKFGKTGSHFYRLAHGMDDRTVESFHDVKSISNEHTFDVDTTDLKRILKMVMYLSEKVGFRLREQKLFGKTIHLKLRYDDFTTLTRNRTLSSFTNSTETIYVTILELFNNTYQKGRSIRLLGVGISGFSEEAGQQLNLFQMDVSKKKNIDEIEDQLIRRFGTKIISRAESLPGRGKT